MSRLMCLLTAAVPGLVLKDDPKKTKGRLLIYPKRPADVFYRNYRCHSSHENRDKSLISGIQRVVADIAMVLLIQHMQAYIIISISIHISVV